MRLVILFLATVSREKKGERGKRQREKGRTFGEREKCANISGFGAASPSKEMENNIVR